MIKGKFEKKGQFFHYLPLIMLLTLAIFLVFIINGNTKEAITEKGVSAQHFLELFREVQKRQLQLEYSGSDVAIFSLEDYALGKIEGECGSIEDVRILIGKEQYCPFSVDEYLEEVLINHLFVYDYYHPEGKEIDTYYIIDENGQAVERTIYIKLPEEQTFEFSYEEDRGILHAVASNKNKYGNEFGDASYSIEPSFDVNLGIDIEENFNEIFSSSITLVSTCSDSLNLESCLDLELAGDYADWAYGTCENPGYLEDNRVVTFCVPSEMEVFDDGELKILDYSFALDFTPLESFVVENVKVEKIDSVGYDIWFDAQDTATAYNVYVTDHVYPDFVGVVEDFYLQGLSSKLFEGLELTVDSLESDCPEPPESGIAYSCVVDGVERIRYVFPMDSLVDGEDYYFAVTSLIDDKESSINGFESI